MKKGVRREARGGSFGIGVFIISAVFLIIAGGAGAQTRPVTQTVTLMLSWTDNQPDNDGTEEGFNIYRCTGTNCFNFQKVNSVGANVVAYGEQIAGDRGGVVYRYQVTAFNAGGESTPSNIAQYTSPLIVVPKPGAPSSLLMKPGAIVVQKAK